MAIHHLAGIAFELRRVLALLRTATAALLLGTGAAQAGIEIDIDKSAQEMSVSVDGVKRYTWSVSTGRAGHATPRGNFRPLHLAEMTYSRKYNNAPMPHSIFFTGRGHAIHATGATRHLGRPASHGCIRLAPKNAAALFDLVERYGMKKTTIVIAGAEPKSRAV